MNMPLWFSNLLFWSAQVALLALAAGFLPRLFQIRQPRVLLAYWRAILGLSLVLPFVEPWHRIESSVSIASTPRLGSISAIPASNPAVTHWHFSSFQIIAEILGVLILAGIAATSCDSLTRASPIWKPCLNLRTPADPSQPFLRRLFSPSVSSSSASLSC